MRTVLVTGGNGDLGIAIAEIFLKQGDLVFAGVNKNRDQVDRLLEQYPEHCFAVALNVTEKEGWRAAIDEITKKTGRLDVLVNNAGKHQDSLLAMMEEEAWDSTINLNLTGTFLGCQAVIREMIGKKFGRIINISSLSAIFPPAGQTNYAAAKAGVVAMSQSLAKEVARLGITVNVVCPGYIESGELQQLEADKKRELIATVPMRRFGRPEEVAAVVRFLASKEASYVTGATIKVDGGIL